MNAKFFEEQRREMVATIRPIAEHIAAELGKTALDERVLRAMAKVPRHEFVPAEVQSYAYLNRPIPIGFDKTISQPLMVAVMTDLLERLTTRFSKSAPASVISPRCWPSRQGLQRRNHRRTCATSSAAAETTGLYQRRSSRGQRLCRLAEARTVRQSDGD